MSRGHRVVRRGGSGGRRPRTPPVAPDQRSRLRPASADSRAEVSRRAAGLTSVDEVRCRPAVEDDVAFLATMLGEAAVWRPDKPTPSGEEVMADPRYAMYLAG